MNQFRTGMHIRCRVGFLQVCWRVTLDYRMVPNDSTWHNARRSHTFSPGTHTPRVLQMSQGQKTLLKVNQVWHAWHCPDKIWGITFPGLYCWFTFRFCFSARACCRRFKVSYSALSWYDPLVNTDLRKSAAIYFVSESANCTVPSIHLMHPLWRLQYSRMIARSMAVRLSVELETPVELVSASYTDFASVTTPNSKGSNIVSQSIPLDVTKLS